MNIWPWLTAISAGLVCIAMPRVLAHGTEMCRHAALHQRAFFSAAEPLLSDDDVPIELVSVLAWMGTRIDDAKLARGLYAKVLLFRAKCDESQTELVRSAVESLRPELRTKFHEAERHFLVALSFSTRLGGFWRRASGMNERVAN